jgi:hypothetical protein
LTRTSSQPRRGPRRGLASAWRSASPSTRWAESGLGLFGAAIIYLIIVGPEVFRFDWIVKGLLKGVLIIVLTDSGARLYRMLKRQRFEAIAPSEAPASHE